MSIITISRGVFSGGLAIAEKLAEHLHCPCIDQLDLYQAVRKLGLSDLTLKSIYNGDAKFLRSPEHRIAILNIYRTALLSYVQDCNLVYHGAVGHLLLSSIPSILRVKIIASIDHRVNLAMDVEGYSYEKACKIIKTKDDECSSVARNLYNVDWQDPSLYDIVLNLNNVDVENAVALLIQMSSFDRYADSSSSQREYEDLFLGCIVWSELIKNPQTSSADLMVTADRGHIVIHGNVRSEMIARSITIAAKQISGVNEVTNIVNVETK